MPFKPGMLVKTISDDFHMTVREIRSGQVVCEWEEEIVASGYAGPKRYFMRFVKSFSPAKLTFVEDYST